MKILIVEDEDALARGLKFNFEQEGFEVTCVGDGPSAVSAFESAQPPVDLVILDLMLPGMSGYQVCTAIRSQDVDVPILVLSARSLSEDRAMAFDCGTDQYLSKPFALPELLSRVRNLTERRKRRAVEEAAPARGPATFDFAGVHVDFRRYEVAARGRTSQLTELELQLLRYFIEHDGDVLTRAEILANVWGERSDLTTRSIDNFVLRLRRIIEANPAEPKHILSVRGAGYRFVARPDDAATTSDASGPSPALMSDADETSVS